MTDAQIATALRRHFDELAAHDAFSGAVLVARHDKVLFERAYGYADHAFNAPNKLDTKFNLGSMGKMFTGVAILQLAQQGKLSLNDTLIKLLPDYPDQDIAGKITLYQLLTHTSGLPDMFNEQFIDTPKEKFSTLQAHLPLFTGKPLNFEPGTKWSYSNAGFIVLGLVLERVSGESYYDYVREHIFKPAGMIHTDNYQPHDDVANLAIGYTAATERRGLNFPGSLPPAGPRITNRDFVQPGASAGGGYSTVEDLLRFARALQGHQLLNPEYTDLDMTGKVATPHGTAKYAFGMEEDFVNGVRIVGHGGDGPGISSRLDIYPNDGYIVAVMSNYDLGRLVNEKIRQWLTGQEVPQTIRLSAEVFKEFTGRYTLAPPSGGSSSTPAPAQPGAAMKSPSPMEITADMEGLWLTSGAQHRLLPLSPTEFFDDNAPSMRFTFVKDEQGRVTGFSFPGPGGKSVLLNKQPAPSTPQAALSVDAPIRKEVAEAVATALSNGYAHAETGQEMARVVHARLQSGAYERITSADEFARRLTADIRAIANDKHLRVSFEGQSQSHTMMAPDGPPPAAMMAMIRKLNGGIARAQILEGNIGYLEVNGLAPLAAAKDAVATAFAFLHNTDALIIDARGNGGGDPTTVALYISYLSEGEPHTVISVHWREGNHVEETRTTDVGTLSYGAKKPVFYLTSHRTFSGGEELGYDLQAFKRATIVGETTGGGANPGNFRPLGHGFSMFLPGGYVVSPVTGSNWEGVGVKPDVPVPAEQALVEAQRLAVERLQASTDDPRQQALLSALALQLKESASGGGTATGGAPNRLNTAQIVGQYRTTGMSMGIGMSPAVIQREDGIYLDLNSPNTPEARLLPLGGDRYRLEGYPDDFAVTFSVLQDQQIQLLVYLSRWPATIAQKQPTAVERNSIF